MLPESYLYHVLGTMPRLLTCFNIASICARVLSSRRDPSSRRNAGRVYSFRHQLTLVARA